MSDQYQTAIQARNELAQTSRAFDLMEQGLLAEFADSEPSDAAKREGIYFQIRALRTVRQALVIAASHADVEDKKKSLAEAGFSA